MRRFAERHAPGAGRLVHSGMWALLAMLTLGSAASAAPASPAALAALAPPSHLEYRVQRGDTLIGLGRRLLADPRQWPVLARDNALRDSNRIGDGQVLRIPVALLRSEAVPASVIATSGTVGQGGAGAAVQGGATVSEGGRLVTGDDGNATVLLVDGTVLRLRTGSQLVVRESRRYPALGQVRSSVQIDDGRVEVRSPKSSGGQPGFEVRTPQGVLGVRGTQFRVAAEAGAQRSLGEVLEGAVKVEGARGAQRVEAGFGSVLSADGSVLPPVALLPMPDLSQLPALQQRVLVRFDFPPLAGAAGYRAQIARDDAFDAVLTDLALEAPPLRVAGLADGPYVLRLRARSPEGLEGQHADHRFTLKARPEAPLKLQPAAGARLVGAVEFRWTANPEAALYWLQVARDEAFTDNVVDRRDLTEARASVDGLSPGSYHWRVTSLRSVEDAGPPGEPSGFELRPTPPAAPAPRSQVDDRRVSLTWPGLPGQHFELQIARDAAFTQVVLSRQLTEPGFSFEPPDSGRFHVRLRTQEADGYVGPYGSSQFFDVPACVMSANRTCVRAGGEPVLGRP